jgi:hypothetical protein
MAKPRPGADLPFLTPEYETIVKALCVIGELGGDGGGGLTPVEMSGRTQRENWTLLKDGGRSRARSADFLRVRWESQVPAYLFQRVYSSSRANNARKTAGV